MSKTLTMNSEWKAIRIKSPAGVWYIARSHEDAKAMGSKPRKNKDGKEVRRAVFSREEIRGILPKLEKLTGDERQKWLGEIINIKEVFHCATVTRVNLKTQKYNP